MTTKKIKKVFSKAEWLKTANADKAAGILTQREIDNACLIWVDNFNGKTKSEIEKNGEIALRDDWFIEV